MKAIGYMRLSFKDQSNYSLDAQEAAIREYCVKNNLDLVALFKDNGQLSSTFNRIDFKALQSFIKRNKGLAQYLIIMEHDRFSRDLSEALSKINSLEKEYGIKVLSVDEPLDIDPLDPTTFISRAFRYATANAELLNIRARTKSGIKRARLEERFINKAPFGYRNGRDLSGKGILTLEIEEAKIVRDIFNNYLSGISFLAIASKAQKMGFNLTGHNAIKRLLSNCLYAGLIQIKSKGESTKYIKALHEAIVVEADFWLAQEMMGKSKPCKLKINRDFPLKGLLKCHCGKYMTAGWSRGRRQYYLYYHCIYHRALNVPGRIIHEQFDQILKALKLTPAQIVFLNKEMPVRLDVLLVDETCQIDARKKMIRELDGKMESLEEHFIEKRFDFATFSKWSKRYNDDRRQLEEHIVSLEKYVTERIEVMEQLLRGINSVYDIYKLCEPLQRQIILKLIFRYGFFFEDSHLTTHKICSALSHNIIELWKKGQLKISEQEVATSADKQDNFLSFITRELLSVITSNKPQS